MYTDKKTTSLPIITLVVLIGFILNSCNSELGDSVLPDDVASYVLSDVIQQTEIKNSFSAGLSRALSYPEVREYVHRECFKQFDGDYNFLFLMHHMDEISVRTNGQAKSVRFGSMVYNLSLSKPIDSQDPGYDRFLLNVRHHIPLLQVGIADQAQIKASDWDYRNLHPRVAFANDKLYEETGIVNSYNSNSELVQLDGSEPILEPTISIYENERVTLISKKESDRNSLNEGGNACLSQVDPIFTDEYFDYYLTIDYYNKQFDCKLSQIRELYGLDNDNLRVMEGADPSPIYFGDGGGGSTPVCDRTRKKGRYDILNQVRTPNRQAFRHFNNNDKGFFEYGLEFKVFIFFSPRIGDFASLSKIFLMRDGDFKNCFLGMACKWVWADVKLPMIRWYEDEYGLKMQYHFWEEDGGTTISMKANVSYLYKDDDGSTTSGNSEVTYTVKSKDDDCGGQFIRFCDNTDGEGTEYFPSSVFQFKINQ